MEYKNKISFKILTLSVVLLMGVWSPLKAEAQYYSQNNSKKQITVDKKVRPINGTFVDNIDKSEKVFAENDDIDFSVLVINTGNVELEKISVADNLPQNVSALFNPGVLKDNTISWSIERLGVGESKAYTIRARVGKISGEYPTIRTNKVRADGLGFGDDDRASYFVMGKHIPSTGSESIIWETMIGLSFAFTAIGLRKAARGY